MVIGQYQVGLTGKNRTALPKRFRDELGNDVIIAKWYEGCLVIVSGKGWRALLNKLTGKSELITEPVRDTDRFILGSAFEVELDSQGRFVIPKVLKDYAKLEEELIFVGLGDRVEVWNKNAWKERETYVQENAAQMVEKVSKEYLRKTQEPNND